MPGAVASLQPEDRDLGAALRKIVSDEVFPGDRAQRVLVVSKTAQGYEVHTRLGPKEVRTGVHLSRVRELQESDAEAVAIIHINLRGSSDAYAVICLLEEGMDLYRLRPQSPPKPARWIPITNRMRERWDEVWGSL